MSCPEHNTDAAPRPASRPVLAVLVVAALASSWWGIGRQGVMTWDEGVYFDEARFVVQAIHAVRTHTSIAAATTGFAPRMGRPGNTSLNVVAMAILGLHPWVPAGLAGLLGALAIAGTYLLGRRLFGEDVGRVAALLLLVSPYFLQYRRVGLPEAAGALVAVLVLLRLVGLRERDERRPWVNSLTLGLLLGAGLAINMRLGVLLPVAGLFRLCWLQ
ncbi:MAG: glycosyltransferase family 39 protein, partial [Armatimonadetes bacterium]|nr:glycosyltransferase family 39 protein [Armatimonadota bacterium]